MSSTLKGYEFVRQPSKRTGSLFFAAVALAACGSQSNGSGSFEGNMPPDARIDSSGATLEAEVGEAISLRGLFADADGEVLAHEWRDGAGRKLGDKSELVWSSGEDGVQSILYRVRDDSGAWSHPSGVVIRVGDVPAENHALRLNGGGLSDDGRVKILIDRLGFDDEAQHVDVGADDLTIEFWLKGKASDNRKPARECGEGIAWVNGNIVLDRDRYGLGRKYGISLLGGRPAFGVSVSGDYTLCAQESVLDDSWHHLAFTRTRADGRLSIFVNGKRVAEGKGPAGDLSYPDDGLPEAYCDGPCVDSDPYLVLGAEKHDVGPEYPGFEGLIDELRLSTVIRYSEDFDPPAAPFAADEDTAALYRFDEGSGVVVADSAGRVPPSNGIIRRGGRPRGPEFVPSTVFDDQ